MKLTSIDQLTDTIVGKPGTTERELFQYELRMDVIGTMIREARLKRKSLKPKLKERVSTKESKVNQKNIRHVTNL